MNEVKRQPWLKNFDWEGLNNKSTGSPFIPASEDNFSQKVVTEAPHMHLPSILPPQVAQQIRSAQQKAALSGATLLSPIAVFAPMMISFFSLPPHSFLRCHSHLSGPTPEGSLQYMFAGGRAKTSIPACARYACEVASTAFSSVAELRTSCSRPMLGSGHSYEPHDFATVKGAKKCREQP